jgi:hypothetical protein
VRPIAASLATCLAFSVAVLGWVALTGGADDQLPQALTQEQTPPAGANTERAVAPDASTSFARAPQRRKLPS